MKIIIPVPQLIGSNIRTRRTFDCRASDTITLLTGYGDCLPPKWMDIDDSSYIWTARQWIELGGAAWPIDR